jgi:hypothetical protein
MKLGFQLIQLKLTGSNVSDAEVTFAQGLNVITGPSDTGKTFILQCINYVLGGNDVPKRIPEAKGYDSVILAIKKNADGEVFELKRSLQKAGHILLSHDGDDDIDLNQKHVADKTDNISGFLLETLNMVGKKVRKNKWDETVSLSFRNLVHLTIISEETIIRETSPVLKENYTTATTEKSVFSLLLTGIDDAELIAADNTKISKVRINAKIEMLHDLVSQTQEQIEQQDINYPLHILQTQLDELNSTYEKSCEILTLAEESITEIEQERLAIWKKHCKIESRLNDLVGLDNRFELLDSQYNSDIRRLSAIVETSQTIDKMMPINCPVCGSPATCHDENHQLSHIDFDLIVNSSLEEITRTRALITDLKTAVSDMNNEIEELSSQQMTTKAELEAIDGKIQGELRPKVKEALDATREIQEQIEKIHIVFSLYERQSDLLEMIKTFETSLKEIPESQNSHSVDPSYFREFCNEIESLLKAWNYPGTNRVEFNFNPKVWDIIIDGHDRKSHGKGVRALYYATFALALLRYCVTNNLPHPGFVIIDSPLLVYKEPDSYEDTPPPDVKNSFFIQVASLFAEEQVIILENEVPPEQSNYEKPINIIKFTKTKIDRYGFIPVSEESSE